MPPRIAVVLKGYPRLSETFVAQESRELEREGFELCIFSLRHPYDPATHPVHDEIEAPVVYLPEYARDDPLRVLRAGLRLAWRGGFWLALLRLLADLPQDPTRNRLRRFAQALVLAAELPPTVTHLYTHFMHTPASVSYYASFVKPLSLSISAHAKDIWTIPRSELGRKLARADWVVTCTAANADYLRELAPDPDRVTLVYHGLDFSRFDAPPGARPGRDGADPADPVRLLSVGRAVEKKGYDLLLDALAALPPGLHWKFIHIGGGELLARLQQRAIDLGIEAHIEWRGPLAQTEVLANYRAADLFVLPSRITDDGDRDGLPNVLMEAQSQSLACLSTDISGIPELIVDGDSGVLVAPNDAAALTRELQRLIAAPAERARLGASGFTRVRAEFSLRRGIDTLTQKLRASLAR